MVKMRFMVHLKPETQKHRKKLSCTCGVVIQGSFPFAELNAARATCDTSERRAPLSSHTGTRHKSASRDSRSQGTAGSFSLDDDECAPVWSLDGGLVGESTPERSEAS